MESPVHLDGRRWVMLRGRPIAYGLLSLTAIGLVLAHWPGNLDTDAHITIAAVRTGLITDQLSPVITWLWRQAHRFSEVGPGAILALQTTALVLGIYLLLRASWTRVAASTITVAILVAPPTFGLVGLVGRDAWFVSSCLLSAGLGVAALRWSGDARQAAGASAIATAVTAIAARQNAFTAVAPIMAGLLALMMHDLARPRGWSTGRWHWIGIGIGAIATAVMLVAVTAAGTAVSDRSQHPEVYTYVYDLGHLTLATDQRFIPALPEKIQPVQTVAEVKARWDPNSGLPLRLPESDWFDTGRWLEDPTQDQLYYRDRNSAGQWEPRQAFPLFLNDHNAAQLATAWRKAISDHPTVYLSGRAALWARSIGIGTPPTNATPDELPQNPFGYKAPSLPVLADAARAWTALWVDQGTRTGSAVHQVWPYLLICMLGLILLLPRFDPPVRMIGVLMAAVVGLQVGLFFMAPSVELRFQLLTFYGAMIALAVGIQVARKPDTVAVRPALVPHDAVDRP